MRRLLWLALPGLLALLGCDDDASGTGTPGDAAPTADGAQLVDDGVRDRGSPADGAADAAGDGGQDAGPPPNPDRPADPSAQIERGFRALSEDSAEPVRFHFVGGVPTWATFDVPAAEGASPVEAALDFLSRYKEFYRLRDPREQLRPTKIETDQGLTRVNLGFVERGREVLGAQLRVHLRGDRVVATIGRYSIETLADLPTVLDEGAARRVAVEALGYEPAEPPGGPIPPRLVVFAPSLVGAEGPPATVWQVTTPRERLLVDARSGQVRYRIPREFSQEFPETFTLRDGVDGGCAQPIRGEDNEEPHCVNDLLHVQAIRVPTGEVVQLYGYTRDVAVDDTDLARHIVNTYNYYRTTYGRYGWDGVTPGDCEVLPGADVLGAVICGAPLPPPDCGQLFTVCAANPFDRAHTVAVNRPRHSMADGTCPETWQNAHYNPVCDVIEFGVGRGTSDVVTHEFTHAVLWHARGLVEAEESGAVNEGLADIMAALQDDNWLFGDTGPDGLRTCRAPENLAVDMPCPAMDRNLSRDHMRPHCCGHPNHREARFDARRRGYHHLAAGEPVDQTTDYGWVHENSTILSHAAWLVTRGGTHEGTRIAVQGLGLERARKLYYQAAAFGLSPISSFDEVGRELLEAARDLQARGVSGFVGQDGNQAICAIRNAHVAVGIFGVGDVDADCDGRPDAWEDDDDQDGIHRDVDTCPGVFNPGNVDTDGDRQGDACDADDDNDNRGDGQDNCPLVVNPDQADRTDDGTGDACQDTDGDGLLDLADHCPFDADLAERAGLDLDADEVNDACDPDLDGDNVANEVDLCPRRPPDGAAHRDDDRDGWGDECDNCRFRSNPDQRDTNGNGTGDLCDWDIDGDGVRNEDDNCDFVPNPDQWDADRDGIGAACDPHDWAQRPADPGGDPFRQAEVDLGDLPAELNAVRLPMEVCNLLDCRALPAGGAELDVRAEVPAALRVLDENGDVVVARPPQEAHHVGIQVPPDARGEGGAAMAEPARFFVEIVLPAEAEAGGELVVNLGPAFANRAPVIILPPQILVRPGQRVEVQARVSDPEGDGMVLFWRQNDGNAVALEERLGASTAFVAPDHEGAFVELALHAIDAHLASTEALVTIEVSAEQPVEVACADTRDNDVDGLTDCADADCVGRPCNDANVCTIQETCDPERALCVGIPVDCDDGDPCTRERCDPDAGCFNDPIPGCCVDDAQCPGDLCARGRCELAGETGRCVQVPLPGCCEADADCEDGDPCTLDTCDNRDCVHMAGNCCQNDADCPPAAAECDVAFCNAGRCDVRRDGGCCPAGDLGCVPLRAWIGAPAPQEVIDTPGPFVVRAFLEGPPPDRVELSIDGAVVDAGLEVSTVGNLSGVRLVTHLTAREGPLDLRVRFFVGAEVAEARVVVVARALETFEAFGEVRNRLGHREPGARVRVLPGGPEVQADPLGQYRLPDLPAGVALTLQARWISNDPELLDGNLVPEPGGPGEPPQSDETRAGPVVGQAGGRLQVDLFASLVDEPGGALLRVGGPVVAAPIGIVPFPGVTAETLPAGPVVAAPLGIEALAGVTRDTRPAGPVVAAPVGVEASPGVTGLTRPAGPVVAAPIGIETSPGVTGLTRPAGPLVAAPVGIQVDGP